MDSEFIITPEKNEVLSLAQPEITNSTTPTSVDHLSKALFTLGNIVSVSIAAPLKDRCSIDSSSLQSKLNDIAKKILMAALRVQAKCIGIIDVMDSVDVQQRIWMALLQAACDIENTGDRQRFLNKATNLLGSRNYGSEEWRHLIDTWGVEPLLTLAKGLTNHANCFKAVESGSWASLRQQIGMALIEWGRQQQNKLKPRIHDYLLPNRTHIDKVKTVLANFLNKEKLLTIDSPKALENVLSDIMNFLNPRSGTPVAAPSKEEQEQLEEALTCMQAGLLLLYPEIFKTNNLEESINHQLSIPLVNLLQDYIAGKRTIKLLQNSSPQSSCGAFTTHYLLSNSKDEAVHSLYENGLHSWTANFLFVGILKASFMAMGQQVPELCQQIEEGQLCATAWQALNCFADMPKAIKDQFSKRLYRRIQEYVCNKVLAGSTKRPMPIELGWTADNTGHCIWGRALNRQIQLINSGIGIDDYHPARSLPWELRTTFSIAFAGPTMTTTGLRSYLMKTTNLCRPKALQEIATLNGIKKTASDLDELAVRLHYDPLKTKSQRSLSIPFGHPQRGDDCTVKALKRLVRLSPSTDQHNELFHITAKLMTYSTWGHHCPLTEAIDVELRKSLVKAIFGQLDNLHVPLKTLQDLAQYLVTDKDWLWVSPSILRRVYMRILREGSVKQASEWIDFLFNHNYKLALKYVSDSLEGYMEGSQKIQYAVAALQCLIAYGNNNPDTQQSLYSDIALQTSCLKDFNWERLVQVNSILAIQLSNAFNKDPDTKEMASVIRKALKNNKENSPEPLQSLKRVCPFEPQNPCAPKKIRIAIKPLSRAIQPLSLRCNEILPLFQLGEFRMPHS